MPLYSRDGETAAIMALAPVIPVLTVASVEDGLAQAKALVAGGLYADIPAQENDAARAVRAALAIQRALVEIDARNASSGAQERHQVPSSFAWRGRTSHRTG